MFDPVRQPFLFGGFSIGWPQPTNMVVSDQLKLSGDRIHGVGERVEGLRIYDAPECATKIRHFQTWSLGITLAEF